uniref:Tetraspanin n=1 Tax=Mesocestoides corti TaxID=53468 RepID=A0A5K3FHS7_MESCO
MAISCSTVCLRISLVVYSIITIFVSIVGTAIQERIKRLETSGPDGFEKVMDKMQEEGCAQALDDALKSYTWAIGISVVLLCLIEIVAVVSAFRLARKQREAA